MNMLYAPLPHPKVVNDRGHSYGTCTKSNNNYPDFLEARSRDLSLTTFANPLRYTLRTEPNASVVKSTSTKLGAPSRLREV